jgi:hypothetical protein
LFVGGLHKPDLTDRSPDQDAQDRYDVRLQAGPPDSPVDRRGQIVERILDSEECARYFHRDAWIERGIAYQKALRACQSDGDHDRLARDQPDVHAAYALHGSADKLTRGEIDGRLLAGQSFAAVADLCGLSAGAVGCYSILFFDVADKLGAADYILASAMGGSVLFGDFTDADVFLRLVGFQDGPVVLGQFLRYLRGGWSVPERLDGVSAEQLDELTVMLQIKALIALYVRPLRQCGPVFRLYELPLELQTYVDSLRGVVRPRDRDQERRIAVAKAVCAAHAKAATGAGTFQSTAPGPQRPAAGTTPNGEAPAVLPISEDGGATFLSALRLAALTA